MAIERRVNLLQGVVPRGQALEIQLSAEVVLGVEQDVPIAVARPVLTAHDHLLLAGEDGAGQVRQDSN